MADNASPWRETKTPLLANATFTGAWHYVAPLGSGIGASYFGALFTSDKAGTCYIDFSDDGSTSLGTVSTLALTAGSLDDLTVRIRAPYYRVRFVNGGADQTSFAVFSNLTQA